MEKERQKALQCLRKLIIIILLKDDTDLKLPLHDEEFLIRFVRGRKYNVEVAHQTVRKYFAFKMKNPKIFSFAYPSYEPVRQLLKTNAVMKLKHNDLQGRPIIVWNFSKWDTEVHNLDHMTLAGALVIEEMLFSNIDAQIHGIVSISNLKPMSFSHYTQFTPGRIASMFQIAQGSYPLKIKQSHCIKEPPIIALFLYALKPFMPKKFKERLVFYGYNLAEFHTVLPIETLPDEYGGKLIESEAYDEDFKQRLFNRDDYYKDLMRYGFVTQDKTESEHGDKIYDYVPKDNQFTHL